MSQTQITALLLLTQGRILTNDEAIRNIEEEGGAVGSRVAA